MKTAALLGLALFFPEAAGALLSAAISSLIAGLAIALAIMILTYVIRMLSYALVGSAVRDYMTGNVIA